jgi:AraC family transcriptional regulator, regulatory protein of adaptative response / methylphosphotriester-DNA alkyltransferase methyltransferase
VRVDRTEDRRRLYVQVKALIGRGYRDRLTLSGAARELASSSREIQRAYAEIGETSFGEDLRARRMQVAARLLAEQPSLRVADVARLVGYRQAPHFSRAFAARYGSTPSRFRELSLRQVRERGSPPKSGP